VQRSSRDRAGRRVLDGGGALGALVWAAIAYYAQMEIGYVAWGVGALVGFASAFGGGGTTNGVLCAAIALLSIFAGKMLAVRAAVGDGLGQVERNLYAEMRKDAADFARVEGDQRIKAFKVSHDYTEAKKATAVKDEELERFKETQADMLLELAEQKPTFEEWREREEVEEMLEQMGAQVDVAGIAMSDLNAIDLIFAFLGIATARQPTSAPGSARCGARARGRRRRA
jgi:hypothetical protein